MNTREQEMTEEDLTDLLARPGITPEAGSEVAALHAALRSYRAETLQWAERRSSTMPSLQPAARRGRVWAALPQWSLAAVAVISIAAGVAHVYDWRDGAEVAAPAIPAAVATSSATGASAADIAADNALLSSIDHELSYHAASPVEGLGLKPSSGTRPSTPGVID